MTPRRDLAPIPFWSPDEVAAALSPVVAWLQQGGILAYPTETVYGFGTTLDPEAVERLVSLKRRPPGKPFLLLINDSGMLSRLGLHLPRAASSLAARFWPGPLTLVVPGGERRVPERLRGPEGGIAVRWTPHPGLQRLIGALGDPITSTSANLPGQPPAASATEVLRMFAAAAAADRIRVLDGGRLVESEPSTVVDCTGRIPRVIRPGAVSARQLREVVPELVGDR